MFEKLISFTKDVSDLATRPALDPEALKAQFDAAPNEVREYLNKLIDALKKTETGDSGAKNIGATTISGLVGNDVQTLLENINKKLPAAGVIDTFSIGAGGTVDKTITYPAGKFSVRPSLVYSLSAGDITPLYTLNVGITSNNKDGATLKFTNKGSNIAHVIVYWQAKDME